MKQNRKKTETYRFNGAPHANPKSIHAVTIADLEMRIVGLEAKLANPNDVDDKRWTERWLKLHKKELSKKCQGLLLKSEEKSKPTFRSSKSAE